MDKFYIPVKSLENWGNANKALILVFISLIFFVNNQSFAQTTTSWKGTSSNAWFTAANWTNGVPGSTTDVIIGDANFTGANNPIFSSSVTVNSLTLGGAKAASFTLSDNKTILKITKNVSIAANGTLNNTAAALYIGGQWSNAGSYVATSSKQGSKIYNAAVILNGTTQSISGATTFMDLTINQGSTTTLSNAIKVTNNFAVSGTFDPATFLVTLTGSTFTLATTGNIKVKAGTFTSNYSIPPSTVNTGATVEFAAADLAQSINAFSNGKPYSTLVVSGSTTKTLTSNISFASATTTEGKLIVNSGILDLSTFTANRATSGGGSIDIANGATLKIGGTNTFPANFATRTFGITSTVEYSGTNQTVTPETYGNLALSASSGTGVTKTMPSVAFTLAGNLISSAVGTGTSVSFTAGQNITVNGNIVLGTGTTFNGGAFTHTLDGDWTNAGTFTGSSSTMVLRGTSKVITGTAHTIFNNLSITGSIRGKAASITVAGNLATSGAGTFIHSAEVNGAATTGTFTMSGTTKTISGTGYTFDDLVISGSVSSASDLTITGNLNASNTTTNSFNLTGGTVWFSGAAKTISAGSATSLNFNALRVTGTVSTGSSFSLKSDFSGNGTLTATAGTITFAGTSTYVGNHKLFSVTLNGTKLQLAANSNLGIANTFTIMAGIFDANTTIPNIVEYNGGTQNITGTTYHTLLLAGTGTKTGINNITTNSNLQINAGITFNPGNFTHIINGNWINNGTFTAGTSTIQFSGNADAQTTGATTFATLTLNKSTATNTLTLNNNISAATVNMLVGEMRTGANAIIITGTRTGPGIILGTITRTHTFAANTPYAFEGPNNLLSFGTLSGITSVTVIVKSGSVSNFPYGGSVNRLYNISINSGGTYSNASLRLHYQENELNGNIEGDLNLWSYGSAWLSQGRTSSNATDNWVDKTSLSSLTGEWTFSQENVVMRWTGTTSSDWNTASNWSAVQGASTGRVPLATDIVDLGGGTFTNQPVIGANTSVKSIQLGSAKNITLTLDGGNLTLAGNLTGSWSGNATHTLAVGNQTLTIGGDLNLSDGTTGHVINLSVGAGSASVARSLIQSGNAAITFTGAGNVSIGNDFQYTNGTFTAGTGTVTYNGNANQVVAGNISYYHLVFNKSAGIATTWAPATILGNLTLATGATLVTNGNLTVAGNVEIGVGTNFNGGADVHTVGGNWTNNGNFVPSSGTIRFTGSGNQSISATTFNNLTVNKISGTATLTGNLTINGNVFVEAGSLDLVTKTLTRSAAGGSFNLLANSALYVGDGNNFPANFNGYNLDNSSTVYYNGAGLQNVARVSYGNLTFLNGNTNAKSLVGATTVKGSLTINTGATLNAGTYTLTAEGEIINNGAFNAGAGTFILAGINADGSRKSTFGNFVFNDLTVTGKYELKSGSFTANNTFYNSGTISAGNFPATFSGNFTNEGTMITSNSVTFTGTQAQTIQLKGALNATGSSVVNFNGSVAPVLNSTSNPAFASVNIRNTAGITASANWTVVVLFKVFSGSTFNGGILTHTFLRGFVNEGTVTSEGVLDFNTTDPQNLALGANLSSSGLIRFGGTEQATFSSTPANFAHIEITNSNVAGVTPAVNWNINGNLNIKSGGILNGGTGLNHTLKGNFSNEGSFNGNSSTITFASVKASARIVEGSGLTNFYHIVINDTINVVSNINVKGDFTNNSLATIDNNIVNFNGSTAQNIAGTSETTFYDLKISNTASPVTAATNFNVANTLTIESGGIFRPDPAVVVNNSEADGTLTGSGTIEVNRTVAPSDYIDQYKFATYDLNALTVKFSGTAAQSSSLTSFYNLIISNPAGFTLSGPTTVSNTLRLESGNITNNGNLLTVGTSAAAPGSVELVGGGTVIGKLKRWIPAGTGSDILFPVGTGTIRRLATIHFTSAPSGGTLTAEFVPIDPGMAGLPLTEPNGDQEDIVIDQVGTSGYWTVTAGTTGGETLTGGVYNASFEATDFTGISNLEKFVMLKRSNNTQSWSLNGDHVPATGSAASPVISRTGLSGFSDFTLGGEDLTPLPVTITAFKAVIQGSDVLLTWRTAMEINNQGYYVEVSSNGITYRSLSFVESKVGNSQTEQTYYYSDTENGKQGARYYRLKQVDYGGKATYYGPKVVSFKEEANWLVAFPNPFSQTVEVLIESHLNEIGFLSLIDSKGKEVWATKKQVLIGKNRLPLIIPGSLAKGIYFLQVQLNQTRKTIKLVKE